MTMMRQFAAEATCAMFGGTFLRCATVNITEPRVSAGNSAWRKNSCKFAMMTQMLVAIERRTPVVTSARIDVLPNSVLDPVELIECTSTLCPKLKVKPGSKSAPHSARNTPTMSIICTRCHRLADARTTSGIAAMIMRSEPERHAQVCPTSCQSVRLALSRVMSTSADRSPSCVMLSPMNDTNGPLVCHMSPITKHDTDTSASTALVARMDDSPSSM
mmetsp:Transcript_5198/g.18684  ORF Transcript_5198/g.18684 Transcript_5198/m.18684 type:complete len:217 (-) Transcript_5198:2824-3474(-)